MSEAFTFTYKWKTYSLLLIIGLLRCGQAGINGTAGDLGSDVLPRVPSVANKSALLPAWGLTCPTGSWLTYENFGQGFMIRNCTSCHHADLGEGARAGAPITVNLDTLDGILIWREKIFATTTNPPSQGNSMPPSNTVRAGERNALEEWLACGAPSNPG